ncbi:MAG: serine/threonine protein kinase [Deltaproteobacteria bacterium]|nr:serine/threonine protein kinase [Deltaproteobacteria bacterium]
MDTLPSFGRYEALFRVAAGGMAEVFAARIRGEAGFEKLVAIKRMLPHLAEDEQFVDMFLDEARVAVHVSSPYVVPTLDLGRAEDGALYIVMELVVGQALSTLIRDQRRRGSRVPVNIALELLAQAAQGLDDAHEAVTPTGVQLGIVHRDVSPHNVLVGVDGRARVTDFGVARALMRRTSTQAGELKGKFAYFSPEQADGRPVDRRADVFALGIVAWETLLANRLFTGDDPLQILTRVKELPIPAVHDLDPEVPLAASNAIARALERSLDRRFATAAELAHALREGARALGPAPSAREIGRWVSEAGGESLVKMRSHIDQALAGDDVPTLARGSGSHRGSADRSGPHRAADRSGSQKAPSPSAPTFVPIEPQLAEPSTVGATTLATETALLRRRRFPLLPVAILSVLAIGGGIALVQLQSSGPAAPVPSSEPAPLPMMGAPAATASQPTTATASVASVSVAAPSKHKLPAPGKTAAPIKHEPAAKPTSTAAPPPPTATATAAPTATAPPTATATQKKNGVLLGDEAFGK